MAISYNNVITRYFSGRVGDIVLKNYSGKCVMAKRPDCSKVIKSARQQVFMNKFAKAVKVGIFAKDNLTLIDHYNKIKPDLSTYHAAISDYQSSLVIEHVDVNEYQGLPGDVVTVSASDNFEIEGVGVVIFNDMEDIVEFGEAVPKEFSGNTEWDYTATVENPDYKSSRILVRVKDRPGNVVEAEVDIGGSS